MQLLELLLLRLLPLVLLQSKRPNLVLTESAQTAVTDCGWGGVALWLRSQLLAQFPKVPKSMELFCRSLENLAFFFED